MPAPSAAPAISGTGVVLRDKVRKPKRRRRRCCLCCLGCCCCLLALLGATAGVLHAVGLVGLETLFDGGSTHVAPDEPNFELTAAVILAGDVAAFNATVQDGMRANLAAAARVPLDAVSLTVQPASVRVEKLTAAFPPVPAHCL